MLYRAIAHWRKPSLRLLRMRSSRKQFFTSPIALQPRLQGGDHKRTWNDRWNDMPELLGRSQHMAADFLEGKEG